MRWMIRLWIREDCAASAQGNNDRWKNGFDRRKVRMRLSHLLLLVLLLAVLSVQTVLQLPLETFSCAFAQSLRTRVLGLARVPLVGHGDLACLLLVVAIVLLLLLLLLEGSAHFTSEASNFVEDDCSKLGDLLDNLEAEIEFCGTSGLVAGVVPDGKVWVLESFFGGDTLGGNKGEHLLQQVEGVGVGTREELLVGDARHERQPADILAGARGANELKSALVRGTEDVENLVELVDVILALEEGLTSQKFGKDTSN
jgi:hypothetical protein